MYHHLELTAEGQTRFSSRCHREAFALELAKLLNPNVTGYDNEPPYDNSPRQEGDFWQLDQHNDFFLKFCDDGKRVQIHPRNDGGVDDQLIESCVELIKVRDQQAFRSRFRCNL